MVAVTGREEVQTEGDRDFCEVFAIKSSCSGVFLQGVKRYVFIVFGELFI